MALLTTMNAPEGFKVGLSDAFAVVVEGMEKERGSKLEKYNGVIK